MCQTARSPVGMTHDGVGADQASPSLVSSYQCVAVDVSSSMMRRLKSFTIVGWNVGRDMGVVVFVLQGGSLLAVAHALNLTLTASQDTPSLHSQALTVPTSFLYHV